MTPHDQEVRLYNDIMHRIQQIEGTINKLFSNRSTLPKEAEDAIFLAAVYAKDLNDKFTKYANRKYE